jgi:hypothetical protein
MKSDAYSVFASILNCEKLSASLLGMFVLTHGVGLMAIRLDIKIITINAVKSDGRGRRSGDGTRDSTPILCERIGSVLRPTAPA